MSQLTDDIKRVPTWVWLAGAGAAVGLAYLHLRSGGAAAATGAAASAPLTSGNGNMVPGATTPDALPSQYNPVTSPAAATSPPQVTFAQALGAVLPSTYNPSGFSNNATDSAQGTTDLFNTLSQFGTTDTGYQSWLAQLKSASSQGNVQQYHQLIQQGAQTYGPQFGSQAVAAQGTLGQAVYPNGVPAQSAPAAVGGGYVAHPDAPAMTGSLRDYFGLAGPNNPSLYGAL